MGPCGGAAASCRGREAGPPAGPGREPRFCIISQAKGKGRRMHLVSPGISLVWLDRCDTSLSLSLSL